MFPRHFGNVLLKKRHLAREFAFLNGVQPVLNQIQDVLNRKIPVLNGVQDVLNEKKHVLKRTQDGLNAVLVVLNRKKVVLIQVQAFLNGIQERLFEGRGMRCPHRPR